MKNIQSVSYRTRDGWWLVSYKNSNHHRTFRAGEKLPQTIKDFVIHHKSSCTMTEGCDTKLYTWE